MGFLRMLHIFKHKTTAVFNIAVKQQRYKMANMKRGLLVCFFKSLIQAQVVDAKTQVMAGSSSLSVLTVCNMRK